MSIEAMKQALDALKRIEHPDQSDVIDVLRQAIAELESQEPVAKVVLTETLELPCLQWLDLNRQFDFKGGEYLYTHPPQRTEQEPDDMASILACRDMLDAQPVPPRTWVGLTDEDMYVVSEEESCSFIAGAKWSEEILKGKNT